MKVKHIGLIAAGLLFAAGTVFSGSASAQNVPVQRNPIVIHEDHHDVSPPLIDMIRSMPPQTHLSRRLMREPATGRPPIVGHGPDTALQTEKLPNVGVTIGLNFAGVGQGDYGFSDSVAPPDTNASAGDTQVVQWVNESYAVFDKSTGALLAGPTAGNSFWSGFGGSCQTFNDGDVNIKYDQVNNRWIAGQLVFETTPYMYCIAVSTSDNALGTYNRYAISFGSNLADYPKRAVWPDAYYLRVIIFVGGFAYAGPEACAMNAAAMRAGQTMTAQCFQPKNAGSETFMLPSDMDGQTLPPAGEPDIFVDLYNSTTLHTFQFHVDFTNPSNSTFSGPFPVTVASYSDACGGNAACVQQPSPGEVLDSLGDRVMFRFAYRNYGTYESLVVTHSITPTSGTGKAAIRWYEIRTPLTPTIFQQGTFQLNKFSTWMGSVAEDKVGDLATGFSISSTTLDPSILISGRVPTDALGKLENPKLIKKGGGVQQSTSNRWGDYSSMAIDPTDDCTFWYTTEYYKKNGSFAWSTELASFKFPGCH